MNVEWFCIQYKIKDRESRLDRKSTLHRKHIVIPFTEMIHSLRNARMQARVINL